MSHLDWEMLKKVAICGENRSHSEKKAVLSSSPFDTVSVCSVTIKREWHGEEQGTITVKI